MLSDLSTVEVATARAAICVAWNLPHAAQTRAERAKEARLDLLLWDDLDSAAQAMALAFLCERHLTRSDHTGCWRVSATQLVEAAGVEVEVATRGLALLGARREGDLWTTHNGEDQNPLVILPASAFTHL